MAASLVLCLLFVAAAAVSGEDRLVETITIEVTPSRNASGDWSWGMRQEQAAGLDPLQEVKFTATVNETVKNGMTYELIVLQFTAQRQRNSSFLDYTHFPGIGYYKLHLTRKNWFEAKAICETEGSHLVVINSEEEAAAMRELMKGNKNLREFISIGFNDQEEHGRYVTLFGQTIQEAGYAKWDRNQPDNKGGVEHCGSMNIAALLNDEDCEYICEFVCEHAEK